MKSLIVANWKMNPATVKEAKKLFEATKKAAANLKGVSVVVVPPSVFLRDIAGMPHGKVGIGAQNAHFETAGSFTGEISVPQVRDAKATHLIIGHAERRAMGESDEDVRKKVAIALDAGLTPILCIGEHARSGDGEHFAFVKEQLRIALQNISPTKLSKIVFAYEPVWAIGAKEAMQPREMHEMSIFIRKTLFERFGEPGMNAVILYGGSIDATNTATMLREGDVKGLLVGRASIDADAFTELLKAAAKA